jgi:uncharacterized MAPEG superfamily protein
MSATAMAVIGLVMWSVVLTFVLLGVRFRAIGGGKELNAFQADGKDLDAFGLRVTRAHANSLEYLATSVGILLLALVLGRSAVTDGLALLFLGCRVGQSVVHMISTAKGMVLLRATLFTVQTVLLIYWAIKLLGPA